MWKGIYLLLNGEGFSNITPFYAVPAVRSILQTLIMVQTDTVTLVFIYLYMSVYLMIII